MTRTLPEWAYLYDENGHHWYNLAKNARASEEGEPLPKAPQRAVYAIPTNDLISLPQWVNSKDPEIIGQVVGVENEKRGILPPKGPGTLLDWKRVEFNGTRTLVQSVSIPWNFEAISQTNTEFTEFLPQFCLYQPPPNSAVLWKEGEHWVVGFSRGDRWIHVQALGTDEEIDSMPSEISLTLVELGAKDLVDSLEQIVVWGSLEDPIRQGLEKQFGLPVISAPQPTPSPNGTTAWKLEPHEVTSRKQKKQTRKRIAILLCLAALAAALLIGLAFFHLWTLEVGNERLKDKIADNSEAADVVESTKNRWEALGPAVDTSRSPVELFHRISVLLPEQNVRLTSFEILDHKTIVISGEASTMSSALQMKTAIDGSEELSDYDWDIRPPVTKNDITQFRATGIYRTIGDEE